MARTPEGEVMAFIRNFFKYDQGISLDRHNVGSVRFRGDQHVQFGTVGESDFSGVVDKTYCPVCFRQTGRGVAIYIEAKAARGRLSEAQKIFLREKERLGAITLVAQPKPSKEDPTGFKHLRQQLERIRERTCLVCPEPAKEGRDDGTR